VCVCVCEREREREREREGKYCLLCRGGNIWNLPPYGRICMQPQHEATVCAHPKERCVPLLFPISRNFHRYSPTISRPKQPHSRSSSFIN